MFTLSLVARASKSVELLPLNKSRFVVFISYPFCIVRTAKFQENFIAFSKLKLLEILLLRLLLLIRHKNREHRRRNRKKKVKKNISDVYLNSCVLLKLVLFIQCSSSERFSHCVWSKEEKMRVKTEASMEHLCNFYFYFIVSLALYAVLHIFACTN